MGEEIQQLLRNGRYDEAFERLLDGYEKKVFRMALAFLGDAARAEDVTQEVFLKLWRVLPGYDGRAQPGTWLYTIARNTCLSTCRSESYRKTVPLDAAREPAAAGPDEAGRLELASCIDRLPEIQRAVIRLFYLEEKSVDAVARLLGMPEGTVKSHLHRARLALGEMIGE